MTARRTSCTIGGRPGISRLVEDRRRALVGVDVVQGLVAVADGTGCPAMMPCTRGRNMHSVWSMLASTLGGGVAPGHALGQAHQDVLDAARRTTISSSSFICLRAQ